MRVDEIGFRCGKEKLRRFFGRAEPGQQHHAAWVFFPMLRLNTRNPRFTLVLHGEQGRKTIELRR